MYRLLKQNDKLLLFLYKGGFCSITGENLIDECKVSKCNLFIKHVYQRNTIDNTSYFIIDPSQRRQFKILFKQINA